MLVNRDALYEIFKPIQITVNYVLSCLIPIINSDKVNIYICIITLMQSAVFAPRRQKS